MRTSINYDSKFFMGICLEKVAPVVQQERWFCSDANLALKTATNPVTYIGYSKSFDRDHSKAERQKEIVTKNSIKHKQHNPKNAQHILINPP